MKLKCLKDNIIFNGTKLRKNDIIEIEKIDQLGNLKGMFSNLEIKEIKIKKTRKRRSK